MSAYEGKQTYDLYTYCQNNYCTEEQYRAIGSGIVNTTVGLGSGVALTYSGVSGLNKTIRTSINSNKIDYSYIEKPSPNDPKLNNIIDQMYRPNAKYGGGSTADAIRYEKATGEMLSPSPTGHLQKGEDSIKAIQNWLRDNPNATQKDIDTAHIILKDLKDSLK